MDKKQKQMYTAYCKNCEKEVGAGSDQNQTLMLAIEHCKENNHELVVGMEVFWFDAHDSNEYVAYCKKCKVDVAESKEDSGKVLISAMEHCNGTKHSLVYGVVVKRG